MTNPDRKVMIMSDIVEFTPVSFEPPVFTERVSSGNPHIGIMFSDSGGNALILTLHPEIARDLCKALAPPDPHRLSVRL